MKVDCSCSPRQLYSWGKTFELGVVCSKCEKKLWFIGENSDELELLNGLQKARNRDNPSPLDWQRLHELVLTESDLPTGIREWTGSGTTHYGGGTVTTTRGLGGFLRGTTQPQPRPDRVILDDPEYFSFFDDDEEVK